MRATFSASILVRRNVGAHLKRNTKIAIKFVFARPIALSRYVLYSVEHNLTMEEPIFWWRIHIQRVMASSWCSVLLCNLTCSLVHLRYFFLLSFDYIISVTKSSSQSFHLIFSRAEFFFLLFTRSIWYDKRFRWPRRNEHKLFNGKFVRHSVIISLCQKVYVKLKIKQDSSSFALASILSRKCFVSTLSRHRTFQHSDEFVWA